MSGMPEGYVEVKDRIKEFYSKHPEGSLRCKEHSIVRVGDQHYFIYVAQAFRTPDDQAPAEGIAWELVPGKTNFTRESEAMNAETSAWGRAIAALGFSVHDSIASANEVRGRQNNGAASEKQRKFLSDLLSRAGVASEEQRALVGAQTSGEALSSAEAGGMIDALQENAQAALAGWRAEL